MPAEASGAEPYAAVYGDSWDISKPLARDMRHRPTRAESVLWGALRGRKLDGCKFRRQHAIDRFIVDFYCAEARLVIELDGAIHQQTADEDAARQAVIENLGLRVIRFRNEQILNDLPTVLSEIRRALSPPSPCNGEGDRG